jgi:transposase-like protein
MARKEIMSGTERRRRWPDEAKLRILAEADQPGALSVYIDDGRVEIDNNIAERAITASSSCPDHRRRNGYFAPGSITG